MDIKDILKNDKAGNIKLLKEKKEALQQFRFNMQGSKVKNVREGRTLKRDIARIQTVLETVLKTA
jgi:ribosomal protein L29